MYQTSILVLVSFQISTFCLCIVPSSLMTQAENKKSELIDTFLKDLISQDFTGCDLFFVDDHVQKSDQSQQLLETIKLMDTSPIFITSPLLLLLLQNVASNTTTTNNNKTRLSYSGFKLVRKRAQCSLVTTTTTGTVLDKIVTEKKGNDMMLQKLSSQYFKLLKKNFDAVTRKDEDHYIFFSHSEILIDKILVSPMGSDIKFKIGLYHHHHHPAFADDKKFNKKTKIRSIIIINEKISLKAKSVCFYCVPGGYAKIVSINLDQKPKNRKTTDLFPDFIEDGNGHEIIVAAPVRTKFLYDIEPTNDGKGWRSKHGIYVPLLEELLVGKMNFSTHIQPSSGGGSGTILKNGTWVGGVKDLMDKKADISMVTSPNYSRYKLVGFSKPICYSWVNFAIGLPQISYTWKAVYQPLSVTLWCFTLLALVMGVGTLKLVAFISSLTPSPNDADAARSSDKYFNRHHLSHLIMVLIDQGCTDPKSSLARMILGLWLFVSLIISTAYRTKLVELMAFPTFDSPPKNFPELANAISYKWGLEFSAVGSSAHNHFGSSSSPVYNKIYNLMSVEKDSYSCFSKTTFSKFACIGWDGGAEYMLHRNFSDKYGRKPFLMSEDLTLFVATGVALQKRALFRTRMDKYIDTSRDMAITNRWKTLGDDKLRSDRLKWEKSVGISHPTQEIDGSVLVLNHLIGPFCIFGLGSWMALLGFVAEVTWHRFGDRIIIPHHHSNEDGHAVHKVRMILFVNVVSAWLKLIKTKSPPSIP